MKSHDLMKALCQWMAAATVVSGAVWAANGVDLSQSPEVSGTQEGAIRMPKEQERMPLNYVNQPPMIPHSVEGYRDDQYQPLSAMPRRGKLSYDGRAAYQSDALYGQRR